MQRVYTCIYSTRSQLAERRGATVLKRPTGEIRLSLVDRSPRHSFEPSTDRMIIALGISVSNVVACPGNPEPVKLDSQIPRCLARVADQPGFRLFRLSDGMS